MARTRGNMEVGESSRPPRNRGGRDRGRGRRGGRASTDATNVEFNPNEAGPSSSYIPPAGPGPLDPSLLTLQPMHRSQYVWNGEATECRFRTGHPLPVHPRIHEMLRDCGFYGISMMTSIKCDRPLLEALLERWRPETHSFHLSVGEMTVTLQDVAILTGLPIDGEAVTGSMDFDPVYLVEEFLGVAVEAGAINGKFIRLKWLKDTFKNRLNDASTAAEVECYFRAYVLTLFGTVLFPNSTGNTVALMFLPLIADIGRIRRFSWGSAILSALYRSLCLCSIGSNQMNGPLILLQIWSWERIHVGRPVVRIQSQHWRVLSEDIDMLPPIGVYWTGKLTWTANPNRCLTYYRDELDRLAADCVVWTPYTEERLIRLPPICTFRRNLWLTKAPLINFGVVEFYYPDRVLRQFGLHQGIPVTVPFNAEMHNITGMGRTPGHNWATCFFDYVQRWNINRFEEIIVDTPPFDLSLHGVYLSWYERVTRRFISPPLQAPAGVVVPIRRPGTEPVDEHSVRLPMYQPKGSAIRGFLTQTWSLAKKCAHMLNSNIADQTKVTVREMLLCCRAQADLVGEGATLDAILRTPTHRTGGRTGQRRKRTVHRPPRQPRSDSEQEQEGDPDIEAQGDEEQLVGDEIEEEPEIPLSALTQTTPHRHRRHRRPPVFFTPDP